LDLFANFIWSYDGKIAWLNHSTWSVNHGGWLTEESSRLNTLLFEKDGAIVTECEHDIAAGTEIFMNYRSFDQPPWYLRYCAKNSITDVRTMVLEAVDNPVDATPALTQKVKKEQFVEARLSAVNSLPVVSVEEARTERKSGIFRS